MMPGEKEVRHTDPVTIGILGYSDIARRRFMPALAASSAAALSAIGTRDPSRFSGKESPSCPLLTYDDLLNDETVRMLYISLPNHLHEKWVTRALAAGKHVICEKPLGLDAASVRRMLDAADKTNRLLYENIMFLHHPQHLAVRELIRTGRIGAVKEVRAVFTIPSLADGNFRNSADMGGGAFHDLNRYISATALFFLTSIPEHFNGCSEYDRNGLNLSMEGTATAGDGTLFSFLLAFGREYRSFYEITGESGKIRLERAYTTPPDMENTILLESASETEEIRAAAFDQFRAAIEHACSLIRGCSGFDGKHRHSLAVARLCNLMEQGCGKGC